MSRNVNPFLTRTHMYFSSQEGTENFAMQESNLQRASFSQTTLWGITPGPVLPDIVVKENLALCMH